MPAMTTNTGYASAFGYNAVADGGGATALGGLHDLRRPDLRHLHRHDYLRGERRSSDVVRVDPHDVVGHDGRLDGHGGGAVDRLVCRGGRGADAHVLLHVGHGGRVLPGELNGYNDRRPPLAQ